MTFSLYCRRTTSTASGPVERVVRKTAEGDVFHLEQDLVVFYDTAGVRGRPIGAANVTALLYIRAASSPEMRAASRWDGWFDDKTTSTTITAAGAEAFFTERGFSVFYDDLARAGSQILAVRCSEVDEIRGIRAVEQSHSPAAFRIAASAMPRRTVSIVSHVCT